jgi:hypothetical protein
MLALLIANFELETSAKKLFCHPERREGSPLSLYFKILRSLRSLRMTD